MRKLSHQRIELILVYFIIISICYLALSACGENRVVSHQEQHRYVDPQLRASVIRIEKKLGVTVTSNVIVEEIEGDTIGNCSIWRRGDEIVKKLIRITPEIAESDAEILDIIMEHEARHCELFEKHNDKPCNIMNSTPLCLLY